MQADGQSATPGTPFAGREAKSASDSSPQLSTLNPQPPPIPDHELLRLIGHGSYGEVWLARNAIGTLRAVKIVHRQSFQRAEHFEREFKGLLKFEPISRSHDGLVDILQIGRRDDAGYFFYVMELADAAEPRSVQCSVGQYSVSHAPSAAPITASQLNTDSLITEYSPRTLRSLLRPNSQPSTFNSQPTAARLPPAECIALGLKLAAALEHLHANGLVHRDIKPSNIIFVNGEPKLADIGLVTAIDEAQSLVGTVGYISPEGPGTPQADLYSLGKVLYEIALGKDRQDFPQLPPDLQSHPDYIVLLELNEVILKACESDPRRRYASATALSEDMVLLQRGQSVRRKRAAQSRWAVVKKIALAVVALALLVAAVTLINRLPRGKTRNPEAVRLYELGRWHQNQLTDVDFKKAIEYLNQAIQIDPDYVEPYVALFGIYSWSVQGLSEKEINQKVKQIADKLLRLAPNLAEGHVALSYSKYCDGDWRGAEEEMQRALRLNPNYAPAHNVYCYYLSLLGRAEEAKAHGRRAQELDPTSRIMATVAGYPFITARQYDLAIVQFRKALELDKNFALAHQWIGKALEAKGDYWAALEEFEKNAILSGADETTVRQRFEEIRQTFISAGPHGYWLKVLEFELKAETSHEKPKVSELDRWPLAGVYAQVGEKEKAFDLLEKEFQESGGNDWLRFEPLYEPLRDEPRFKSLLKKAGLEK